MQAIQKDPLDFQLPPELEAHEPPEARGLRRDRVRLLVSHLEDDSLEHRRFVNLPEVLRPGDLLVANDSATIPAALTVTRYNGSTFVLHISTRLSPTVWVVEPRDTTVQTGDVFQLPDGSITEVLRPYRDSQRLWVASFNVEVLQLLERYGKPIAYPYVRG